MASAFERLSKSKGVSDAAPGGKRTPKIESFLEFADFSDGEYKTGRIYPGLFAMATHWFNVPTKDGNVATIGRTCKRFDPVTQEFDSTRKCAMCEHRDGLQSYNFAKTEIGESRLDVKYFLNFLDRDKQEALPKKLRETDKELESGFKDKSSKSLTPMTVLRLPSGGIEKLQKLQRAGKRSTKLDDPEKGRDITICFNKDEKTPANMWDIQKADEPGEPLSKKEMAYLLWDIPAAISALQNATTYEDDMKDVEKAMAEFAGKKSKNKSKKGGKKAADDEDEDEDEKPAGKKSKDKSKKGGKSKSDDDEDDEDEAPKSKKGGKKAAEDESKSKKGGKKAAKDDDEDEAPKSKKGGKKAAKDDDDEDEPKSKKGGKKSKSDDEDDEPKSKKGGKKSKSDDDDDDEPKSKKGGKSKFDIDDEDEDEPKAKKGGKKSKSDDDEDDEPKSKKKKK